MTRRWPSRASDTEDGASAVEFALIVPMLVMLISGIVGFGFVFAQQIALGNAARQAARMAAVSGPTCGTGQAAGSAATNLTARAKSDSTTIGIPANGVAVTIKRAGSMPTDWSAGTCTGDSTMACTGGASTDNVYVLIQYRSVLNLPFFTPSFNLSATGAFRCEFS